MGNHTDSSKVILAFVKGAALGYVAGVLFAPRSGKETRARLEADARKAAESVSHTAIALTETTKDNLETGTDTLGYVIASSIARITLGIEEIIKIVKLKITAFQADDHIYPTNKKVIRLPEHLDDNPYR